MEFHKVLESRYYAAKRDIRDCINNPISPDQMELQNWFYSCDTETFIYIGMVAQAMSTSLHNAGLFIYLKEYNDLLKV